MDFQTSAGAGLKGMGDPSLLLQAAHEGRLLVTHDVRSMPGHFAEFRCRNRNRFTRSSTKRSTPATVEAVVALYEPGAVLAASSGQPVKGHDAIREAYRGFLAMKPSMTVETLNAFESGDGIALLHGRWSKKATGPDGGEIRMAGRNTEVVRRQLDGSWLFLIDNPFTPE